MFRMEAPVDEQAHKGRIVRIGKDPAHHVVTNVYPDIQSVLVVPILRAEIGTSRMAHVERDAIWILDAPDVIDLLTESVPIR